MSWQLDPWPNCLTRVIWPNKSGNDIFLSLLNLFFVICTLCVVCMYVCVCVCVLSQMPKITDIPCNIQKTTKCMPYGFYGLCIRLISVFLSFFSMYLEKTTFSTHNGYNAIQNEKKIKKIRTQYLIDLAPVHCFHMYFYC